MDPCHNLVDVLVVFPGVLEQLDLQRARTWRRLDPQENDPNWSDHGEFWTHSAPQGTEEWHAARYVRVSGSIIGIAARHCEYPDSNKRTLALSLTGLVEKKFDEEAERRMALGVKYEPVARDMYCNIRNVEVEELGICVPKWDYRLGASLDGQVISEGKVIGNLEIKCPEHMYPDLLEFQESCSKGILYDDYYHQHVKPEHYAQMQLGMLVTQRSWCDYFVMALLEGKIYLQRILFNPEFCKSMLVEVDKFFREEVDVLINYIHK